MTQSPLTTAIGSVFTIIVLVLLWDATVPAAVPEPEPPDEQQAKACVGEPIMVDYPYAWNVIDPHVCAPQCGDDKQRYVLYSNGLATQCETPPGCNDEGEDRGVTCSLESKAS